MVGAGAVAAVLASVFLAALAVTPQLAEGFRSGDCRDYTLIAWRAPGAWDAAAGRGHRILGPALVEERDRLHWGANPLAGELAAWTVSRAAWTRPDGTKATLDPGDVEGPGLATLWLTRDGQAGSDTAGLLAVAQSIDSDATWSLNDTGGLHAQAPRVVLDAWLAGFGAPASGTQVALGFLYVLVSKGQTLTWDGPAGHAEVVLGLDLITNERLGRWALEVDSADRVDFVVEGRWPRLEVAERAALHAAEVGVPGPGSSSWSEVFPCNGQRYRESRIALGVEPSGVPN